MKKINLINEKEIVNVLQTGRIVEGRLMLVEGKDGRKYIEFLAYNRQRNRQKDRTIVELENGWLKESPKRIKFYNSVKKALGRRMVEVVMHRDLKSAMDVMKIQEILDNI